jgi:hypothetical protein
MMMSRLLLLYMLYACHVYMGMACVMVYLWLCLVGLIMHVIPMTCLSLRLLRSVRRLGLGLVVVVLCLLFRRTVSIFMRVMTLLMMMMGAALIRDGGRGGAGLDGTCNTYFPTATVILRTKKSPGGHC